MTTKKTVGYLYSFQLSVIKNRFFRAIIASSIAIVPFAVLRGVIITLSVLTDLVGWPYLTHWLVNLQDFCMHFLPWLTAIFISLHWSVHNRLSSLQCVSGTIVSIITISSLITQNPSFVFDINVVLAVVISLSVSVFQEKLIKLFATYKINNEIIKGTTILLMVIFTSAATGIIMQPFVHNVLDWLQTIFSDLYPKDFIHGLLYELIRDVLWLLGIHGHYFFQQIDSNLLKDSVNNMANWHSGLANLNIISNTFYDTWVASGGSGCTLSMVLCMLVSRQQTYRKLLKTALPLSLLNINEPLVFGIPVILNPFMFIPFLLTPAMSFTVSYAATYFGIVPHIQTIVGWSTPPLINIWIATNGSLIAVVLHAVIITLGAFIYLPFLRIMEKSTVQTFKTPELEGASASMPINASDQIYLHRSDVYSDARQKIAELQNSGNFILYFQPQVRLHDRRIIAIEVLLRHQSHQGKITPPVFLKYYELLGLMTEIDYWVLENAVSYVRKKMSHLHSMTLSVNISPQTLLDYRLIYVVDQILEKPMPLGWELEFEITESQQLYNPEKAINVMKILRSRGIKIALDDFGSGYATLSYLNQYSLDKIKLDRSLLQVLIKLNNTKFFSRIIDLCHSTKADILAEGIETEEECQKMQDAGVKYVQGFLFYRPLPGDEVFNIITAQQLMQEGYTSYDSFKSTGQCIFQGKK